jgi:hypothetical protein
MSQPKQSPQLDQKLVAAKKFVQSIGGIEKAKQALEELKKLQKAG